MNIIPTMHEAFLSLWFYGFSIWNVLGAIITIGIGLSCVCRVNSLPPWKWVPSSSHLLYLFYSAWAMESFVLLVGFQMYSGYDMAIGLGIMLHLHSTYEHWTGDDCVCDALHAWSPSYRRRVTEMQARVNYGRRANDRRLDE